MGNYDAITALRSQGLTTTLGTQDAVNYKRYQALQNAGTLARQAHESVESYHERMQKIREELAKEIEAENTHIVEKRLAEIALFNNKTTNLYQLNNNYNQLQSLLRFAGNNQISTSLDEGIYLAKKQKAFTENQMARIKEGADTQDGSSSPLNSYNFEFQDLGSRDILA